MVTCSRPATVLQRAADQSDAGWVNVVWMRAGIRCRSWCWLSKPATASADSLLRVRVMLDGSSLYHGFCVWLLLIHVSLDDAVFPWRYLGEALWLCPPKHNYLKHQSKSNCPAVSSICRFSPSNAPLLPPILLQAVLSFPPPDSDDCNVRGAQSLQPPTSPEAVRLRPLPA